MLRQPIRTVAFALLLASAAPVWAQSDPAPAEGSPIDDLAPADGASAEVAPPPTGDPVLDRLNALDAKVRRLEARNRELEEKLGVAEGRIAGTEVRAAKGVQLAGPVPNHADVNGGITFKVRGVINADQVAFFERAGGYDYDNGTGFRRARLCFDGTAFKDFNWRLEVDFAGNAVQVLDGYLQYAGLKPWLFTIGQFKAPYGLEANNSDNYNIFVERGMFTNAFGNVGAERRIGVSAQYLRDNFTAAAGLFGENESVFRAPNAAVVAGTAANPAIAAVTDINTPDEGWGVNGRATWEPVNDTGKILHLGAAAYYRTALRSATGPDVVRISERPNVRVDGGNIADSGIIAGVDSATYVGAEAAGIWGPVSLIGEYGRLHLDRTGTLSDPTFDGFYATASWFLTGETRPLKSGSFDRIKPLSNFDHSGGWGALELALRYDKLNLDETPVAARVQTQAQTLTTALNWYLNPYFKLQLNWVRFNGDNTPLDPVGTKTKGDAVVTRVHLDW